MPEAPVDVLASLNAAVKAGRAKRVYAKRCDLHHTMMAAKFQGATKTIYWLGRVNLSLNAAAEHGLPGKTPVRVLEGRWPAGPVGCGRGCLDRVRERKAPALD